MPWTVRRLRSGYLKPLSEVMRRVCLGRTLNTWKGIILSFDLRDCSEVEIKEHLLDQGVTDVRTMTVMRNGQRCNTITLVLTFGHLPKSPKGAKVYHASRRRSNKRVGLKRQLAPHCVP